MIVNSHQLSCLVGAALALLTPVSEAQSQTSEISRNGAANGKICKLPHGWSSILSRHPKYVIFGELHGTQESPKFFSSVVCALVKSGEHVLVAVEYSSIHNDDLQVAWRSPDPQFGTLLAKYDWPGRGDGLASEAAVSMLIQLHSLQGMRGSMDIVAFNGARDEAQQKRFAMLPGQGSHEAAQAENIRTAAEAHDYDRVLILVGSLHAGKAPVTRQGVTFQPMAMRLAPADQIVSLFMTHGAGMAWNCQMKADAKLGVGAVIPADAVECDQHNTPANAEYSGSPRIGLGAPPGVEDPHAYDGYFWLGPIHASPPTSGP